MNRIWGTIEPLDIDLVAMVENFEVTEKDDPKERSKILIEKFNWEKDDTYKIWSFESPNLIVDKTKGVQGLGEIKDSILSAFTSTTREGALAGENMRGLRFNITDAIVHQDPAHRKGAQIIPAARRFFQGLELIARPTLLEPMFMCEITAPNDVLGGIYQTLNKRRGQIIEQI